MPFYRIKENIGPVAVHVQSWGYGFPIIVYIQNPRDTSKTD